MALYVFSINDINLRIYRDNVIVSEEAGFAQIGLEENLFGEQARKQVKLNPRQVNSAFWHRMNLDPLSFSGSKTHNHADLLYQQLINLVGQSRLDNKDEFVILVRGNTSNEQLSLLLGVCQECKIRLAGLADVGVALLSMHPSYSENVVLDMGLQSMSLTDIKSTQIDQQHSVQKTTNSELSELGLIPLMDAWLAIIADRFINDTRFDPLRIADTEQQVFDQVYAWLFSKERQSLLNIEVSYQNTNRNIEISENVLVEKAKQRYTLITRKLETNKNIWLTDFSATLPGLQTTLEKAGHNVLCLDTANAYQAVLAQLPDILSEADEIQFITALKATRPERQIETGSKDTQRKHPTHILYKGFALKLSTLKPINQESFKDFDVQLPGVASDYPISIHVDEKGLSASINPGTAWTKAGHALPGTSRLRTGETIVLGNEEIQFIRVEDGT